MTRTWKRSHNSKSFEGPVLNSRDSTTHGVTTSLNTDSVDKETELEGRLWQSEIEGSRWLHRRMPRISHKWDVLKSSWNESEMSRSGTYLKWISNFFLTNKNLMSRHCTRKEQLVSLTHICSGSEWYECDTSVTNCHPCDRNYLSLISHIFPDARAARSRFEKRVTVTWVLLREREIE